MADLIDRLAGLDVDGRPKIQVHDFIGALRLYITGKRTRAQSVAGFDLVGSEATQAAQLADAIDGKATLAEKIAYIEAVLGVCYTLESRRDPLIWPGGVLNKTQVYSDLEFV